MFRKFLQMNSEDKSSVLNLCAVVLFAVWLAVYLFGISNLCTDILAMTGGVLLTVGCAFMFHAAAEINETAVKPLIFGSFGLVGLVSFEATLSYAVSLFGIALPAVTAYYALPLFAIFIYGLGRLLFAEFSRKKWRSA